MLNTLPVIIVGAGPGGLSVAAALIDQGLQPEELLVLDRGEIGQAWLDYPHDTRLLSESAESHDDNMIADIKTSEVFEHIPHPSHIMYQKYLEHVVNVKQIPVEKETFITKVVFDQHLKEFVLWTRDDKELRCKYLVWAGGIYSTPNESLDFEGAYIHYARQPYLDEVDTSEVTVVGSANGASGVVMQLAQPGRLVTLVSAHAYEIPQPIDCLWKEHMQFVKELESQGLVKIIENFRVKRIYGQDDHFILESETGETLLSASRPIVCTGFQLNIEPIKNLVREKAEESGTLLELDEVHQSLAQPGLYLAGVIGKLELSEKMIAHFREFGPKIAKHIIAARDNTRQTAA